MAQNEDRGRYIKAGELAVVVGAGRSGKAAARLLLRAGRPGAPAGEQSPGSGRSAGRGPARGRHRTGAGGTGAGALCRCEDGGAQPRPAVVRLREMMGPHADAEGTEILAEMELAWRALDGEPVLAVTGTSGKTTTVSLAAAMLREQGLRVFLGGNIGTPLSEYLLSGEKADVLVLETSSFQLQCCSTFHPRVAVVLNISPNHLDYHKDMEEYIEAKFRLFRCQTEEDLGGAGARSGRDRRPLRPQGPQGVDPARRPLPGLPPVRAAQPVQCRGRLAGLPSLWRDAGERRPRGGCLQAPAQPAGIRGPRARRALCERLQMHHGGRSGVALEAMDHPRAPAVRAAVQGRGSGRHEGSAAPARPGA